MKLTDKEKLELLGMCHSFATSDIERFVGEFTKGITELLETGDPSRALSGIEQVKAKLQRMHNTNHTVGVIAAKAFLESEFPDLPWEEIEVAADPNRKGPDIHVDRPPARIVGELKTTDPCGVKQSEFAFGSNQRAQIEKDLNRLANAAYAEYSKYMFVTNRRAFHCLLRDYRSQYPTITLVFVGRRPEVSRPAARVAAC